MRCISFPFENSSCSAGIDKLFDYLIGNSIISLLLFIFWMFYLAIEIIFETDKAKFKGLFTHMSKKGKKLNVEFPKISNEEKINIVDGTNAEAGISGIIFVLPEETV